MFASFSSKLLCCCCWVGFGIVIKKRRHQRRSKNEKEGGIEDRISSFFCFFVHASHGQRLCRRRECRRRPAVVCSKMAVQIPNGFLWSGRLAFAVVLWPVVLELCCSRTGGIDYYEKTNDKDNSIDNDNNNGTGCGTFPPAVVCTLFDIYPRYVRKSRRARVPCVGSRRIQCS